MSDMMFRDAKRRIVPQILTENGYSVIANGDMTGIDIGKYKLLVDKRGDVLPYQYFDTEQMKFVPGTLGGNFEGELPIATTGQPGITQLSSSLENPSQTKAATIAVVKQVDDKVENISAQLEETKFNKVDAKTFGALPNNSADNYTALNNMFKEAFTGTVYDTSISYNRFFTKSINIPAGVYRIKAEDLWESLLNIRTQSLVINGNGAVFVFEGFEGYAFKNNDKILSVTFKNITFNSKNDSTATNRSLFYSYSTGGAQDIKFEGCVFNGTWKNGVLLEGDNNNSEWVFDKCSFSGEWESFLYIGETNTSDQFLNYWFDKCAYWASSTWIKAHKGGHFKLDSCDISGFEPIKDTYLFELLGASHSLGVTTFNDDGSRYELKSPHAKVLKCEWDNARIAFSNSDFSSNAFNAIERPAVFDIKNVSIGGGSNYQFDNCNLIGRFLLQSANSSPLNNLYLKNCALYGDSTTTKVEDIFTYNKGVNTSEFIKVNIENTKFNNKIYNTTLNRFESSHSFLNQNAFFNLNPYGQLSDDWHYTVQGSVLVDEVTIFTRKGGVGTQFSLAVKSDFGTVESVNVSGKYIYLNEDPEILPNGKITFGDSDVVYTIKSYRPASKRIEVAEDIAETIAVGAKASYQLNQITFQATELVQISTSTTKYIVTNDLYVKDLLGNFPAVGVSAKIIVKTIE